MLEVFFDVTNKKYYLSMQKLPINEEDIEGLNTLIEDTIKAYVDNIKEINVIVTTVSVTDRLRELIKQKAMSEYCNIEYCKKITETLKMIINYGGIYYE